MQAISLEAEKAEAWHYLTLELKMHLQIIHEKVQYLGVWSLNMESLMVTAHQCSPGCRC